MNSCKQAGIAVTVVPGITAALGCAAEAGLPLTFRKEATRLTFVTANVAEGDDSVDWNSLADPQSTLVVYMGLLSAAAVQNGLIAAGRDRATPVAVLARGTRPDSKAATGAGEFAVPGRFRRRRSGLARDRRCGRAFVGLEGEKIRSRRDRRMTAPQQQKLKITGPVVVTANRLATAPSSI